MTIKEKLLSILGVDKTTEIKLALSEMQPVASTAPIALSEMKAMDEAGAEVMLTIDGEVVVSSPVMVAGSPAVNGKYTLESGVTIVVVDGLIAEVIEVKAEEPAPVVENDMATQLSELTKRIEKFEGKFSALQKENADLKISLAKQSKVLTNAVSVLDSVMDIPMAMSVTDSSTPSVKKSYDEMSNIEKVKFNRGLL